MEGESVSDELVTHVKCAWCFKPVHFVHEHYKGDVPALFRLMDHYGVGVLCKACSDASKEREEREKYRQESKERQARLKAATGDSQDALLREIMEQRKKRPGDHGMLPGR